MRPLVGVPTDTRQTEIGVTELRCSEKYPRAVRDASRCMPVLIPAWDWGDDLDQLLDRLDGVLLTGARANVHPDNYGSNELDRAAPFDTARDDITLPIVRKVIERGMPIFAICRGFQEMNVALGGSLHPKLHEVDGRIDHRMPDSTDLEIRYGPRHGLNLIEDGQFHRLIGERRVIINSLHGQGIDRLADSLVIEGMADDGTIEAISVKGASGFALGVQWHPEYRANDNPVSQALFAAFGEAVHAFAGAKI